jgi:hypothetical protein
MEMKQNQKQGYWQAGGERTQKKEQFANGS